LQKYKGSKGWQNKNYKLKIKATTMVVIQEKKK
jgi:hypothetical protein